MSKQLKNLGKFLLLILIQLVILPFILGFGFQILEIDLNNDKLLALFWLIMQIIMLLILVYSYRDSLKKQLKKFGKKEIKTSLKFWVLAFVTMMIINSIATLIEGGIPNNEALNRQLLLEMPLIQGATILIAPFIEELIFRFSLRKVFKSNNLFILISGLLFGIIHMASGVGSLVDILHFLTYSLMGGYLAVAYVKTDNIFTSITTHFIQNAFTLLLLLIAGM